MFSFFILFFNLISVAQFFMKATQLEQMREDFVYIKTTRHLTEDKVGQHSEVRISLPGMFLFNYMDNDILLMNYENSLWMEFVIL